MEKIKALAYLKKLGIKMVKTMSEAALALMGTNMFIHEVNWKQLLSAVVFSGIMTIAFNLKDLKVPEDEPIVESEKEDKQ